MPRELSTLCLSHTERWPIGFGPTLHLPWSRGQTSGQQGHGDEDGDAEEKPKAQGKGKGEGLHRKA